MSDELPTAARVSDPGIRALYRLENRWQAWLDVEAALAKAQAELDIIPKAAAAAIAKAAHIWFGRIDIPCHLSKGSIALTPKVVRCGPGSEPLHQQLPGRSNVAMQQCASALDILSATGFQDLPVFLLGLLEMVCLIPGEAQISLEIQPKRRDQT